MFKVIDEVSGVTLHLGSIGTLKHVASILAHYHQGSDNQDVGLKTCAGIFRADEYETLPGWKIDIASLVRKRHLMPGSYMACPYTCTISSLEIKLPTPTLYLLGFKLWAWAINLYGSYEVRQTMDLAGNITPREAIDLYCDDVGLILEEVKHTTPQTKLWNRR